MKGYEILSFTKPKSSEKDDEYPSKGETPDN